jgi:hypothetical protein
MFGVPPFQIDIVTSESKIPSLADFSPRPVKVSKLRRPPDACLTARDWESGKNFCERRGNSL